MIYSDKSKHDDANIKMWVGQNKGVSNKRKSRKKKIPLARVTTREIDAMQEIVNMYIGDEKTHCEINHAENFGSEVAWDADSQEDGDHIYY